jgi:hypothetical protein
LTASDVRRNASRDGEREAELAVTADRTPPEAELSPELVLVSPPDARAQAIAALGAPVWPSPPRARVIPISPPQSPAEEPSRLLTAASLRVVPLAGLFIVTTALTLILTLVANAGR